MAECLENGSIANFPDIVVYYLNVLLTYALTLRLN